MPGCAPRFGAWAGETIGRRRGILPVRDRAPRAASTLGVLWHPVELELVDPPGRARGTGAVLVPSPDAEFGVISDIDDTVVETGVTKRLAMARTVFLGNARTRLPFKGVAAFYDALVAGGDGRRGEPDLLRLEQPVEPLRPAGRVHGAPGLFRRGPLLLRDFGHRPAQALRTADTASTSSAASGRSSTRYPKLPFILIGDSGEKDPEIYRQVVREYPGRILAIYIRRIGVPGAATSRSSRWPRRCGKRGCRCSS